MKNCLPAYLMLASARHGSRATRFPPLGDLSTTLGSRVAVQPALANEGHTASRATALGSQYLSLRHVSLRLQQRWKDHWSCEGL